MNIVLHGKVGVEIAQNIPPGFLPEGIPWTGLHSFSEDHCVSRDGLHHMTLSFRVLVTSSLVPLGSEMVTSLLLLAPGNCTVPCGSPVFFWDLNKWSLCTNTLLN